MDAVTEIKEDLNTACQAMAADTARECEVTCWCNGLIGNSTATRSKRLNVAQDVLIS